MMRRVVFDGYMRAKRELSIPPMEWPMTVSLSMPRDCRSPLVFRASCCRLNWYIRGLVDLQKPIWSGIMTR